MKAIQSMGLMIASQEPIHETNSLNKEARKWQGIIEKIKNQSDSTGISSLHLNTMCDRSSQLKKYPEKKQLTQQQVQRLCCLQTRELVQEAERESTRNHQINSGYELDIPKVQNLRTKSCSWCLFFPPQVIFYIVTEFIVLKLKFDHVTSLL